MESAYTLARKELDEIRRQNKEELEKRKAKIRHEASDFDEVEAVLTSGGISLAKALLGSGESVADIKARIMSSQRKKAEILKRLSLPDDYLDEIFNCTECRDTGFDESGKRCECFKKLVAKYVGVNSNLTEIMKRQTFESFDFKLFENQPEVKGRSVSELTKTVFNKAKHFADNFESEHSNLYLYGNAGTGKTYISSCIANRVLERGFSVYYRSAFELFDMLEKLKFGRYDAEEQDAAEYAAKYAYDADLLIIDDVGTEFITAYSSVVMFDIIKTRIDKQKSTVLSSNFSFKKLDEIYGKRLTSRLTGSYDICAFIGRDLRELK